MNTAAQKFTIEYHEEDGIIILDNIEVNPEFRGQGVATIAMTEFMKKFRGEKIELHAYPQDKTTSIERLVDFYRKFGFETVCGDDSIGYEMNNN
jgi:ribosomal protein S18 acetylase RimI-like enzyme